MADVLSGIHSSIGRANITSRTPRIRTCHFFHRYIRKYSPLDYLARRQRPCNKFLFMILQDWGINHRRQTNDRSNPLPKYSYLYVDSSKSIKKPLLRHQSATTRICIAPDHEARPSSTLPAVHALSSSKERRVAVLV